MFGAAHQLTANLWKMTGQAYPRPCFINQFKIFTYLSSRSADTDKHCLATTNYQIEIANRAIGGRRLGPSGSPRSNHRSCRAVTLLKASCRLLQCIPIEEDSGSFPR